ncbi:hypothetical protein V6N13_046265 [Hibiscus sabdariffa]|uniref:Uncharacterized protein n=1 Tax=Hibiscus sabdariffa TaxID=183260 RepID=A0ABR2D9L2_9ROSI
MSHACIPSEICILLQSVEAVRDGLVLSHGFGSKEPRVGAGLSGDGDQYGLWMMVAPRRSIGHRTVDGVKDKISQGSTKTEFKITVLDMVNDGLRELPEVVPELRAKVVDMVMHVDSVQEPTSPKTKEVEVNVDGSNPCMIPSQGAAIDAEVVGGSAPIVVVSLGEGKDLQFHSNLTKTKVGAHSAVNILDSNKLRNVVYSKKDERGSGGPIRPSKENHKRGLELR